MTSRVLGSSGVASSLAARVALSSRIDSAEGVSLGNVEVLAVEVVGAEVVVSGIVLVVEARGALGVTLDGERVD